MIRKGGFWGAVLKDGQLLAFTENEMGPGSKGRAGWASLLLADKLAEPPGGAS